MLNIFVFHSVHLVCTNNSNNKGLDYAKKKSVYDLTDTWKKSN